MMTEATPIRISPRMQAALVGLAQGYTWREIGSCLGCSQRTIARYIHDARLALGFDPTRIIEKTSLIGRARAAGVISEGMRLSAAGYIVFSAASVTGVRR